MQPLISDRKCRVIYNARERRIETRSVALAAPFCGEKRSMTGQTSGTRTAGHSLLSR